MPIRWVLVSDPQGMFETKALLCTDQGASPVQILNWFVRCWQMEVTFQEVRTHLGVETQRQWSDKDIARTTPTFSDALAEVRRRIWQQWGFWMSPTDNDRQKSPPFWLRCLFEAVCYSF